MTIRKENKTMKKILALVMALILTCVMLVSCDNPISMLKKADAALDEAPYAVTMKMEFECDNDELNQIFSLMNMEIPATVDGENLAMDMSMNMMGYAVDAKMTVADKVMYYNMEMMGESVKMKATMNDEQYSEFMAENNTQMAVNPKDFGKLTVENRDGKKYIACGEISEEGIKALNDVMADSLEGMDGEATVSNVTYGVTISNGKYESIEMTCVYSVTIYEETYNVTFNLSAEFSYDNVEKITAPADADTYEEVSFDDLEG